MRGNIFHANRYENTKKSIPDGVSWTERNEFNLFIYPVNQINNIIYKP